MISHDLNNKWMDLSVPKGQVGIQTAAGTKETDFNAERFWIDPFFRVKKDNFKNQMRYFKKGRLQIRIHLILKLP